MAATNPIPYEENLATRVDDSFIEVMNLVERGVAEGVYPGATVMVAREGQVLFEHAAGFRWLKGRDAVGDNAVSLDTVFDVASLTGVVATTTLVMKLIQSGRLRLEDRASKFITGFGVHGKSEITIAHLLTHTSGLPAWHPFCEELLKLNSGSRLGILASKGARDYVYQELNRLELRFTPGTKESYSDLDFLVLGEIVEALDGARLDADFSRCVCRPLRLSRSGFVDLVLLRRKAFEPDFSAIAPTEHCSWRENTLCGEVHDDNAWAMGGIAGHSGLFMSVRDLTVFGQALSASYHGESDFVAAHIVRRFWTSGLAGQRSVYRCGWESPASENGMASAGLSGHAVGINGFTGCSLWVEPESKTSVAIMTNRVHPSRNNKKIAGWRSDFHRVAFAAAAAR